MAYSTIFSITLGSTYAGKTLHAQIVDSDGNDYGAPITTGFTDLGSGFYQWRVSDIADDFIGSVKFINSETGEILALGTFDRTVNVSGLDVTGVVYVDHNYGGTDALAYIAPDHTPIAGAIIQAFTKEDWSAGRRASDNVRGETRTDANGRWLKAIVLFPGDYVLMFHKPDEFGPTIVDLTVN